MLTILKFFLKSCKKKRRFSFLCCHQTLCWNNSKGKNKIGLWRVRSWGQLLLGHKGKQGWGFLQLSGWDTWSQKANYTEVMEVHSHTIQYKIQVQAPHGLHILTKPRVYWFRLSIAAIFDNFSFTYTGGDISGRP